VIWQGPDIPCIKICNGDTVSTIVHKLATELCTVLDTLDVANYDLSCFNITACGPSDFQHLIQFLIDQICELQNVVTPITPGNPLKELITVDDCFIEELGETTTLEEYVHAIAKRVCSIILQIAVINSTLIDYGTRITILESYFPLPTPSEPQITPDCVLPAVPTNISTVLQALELAFCNLINVTGNDTDLYNAIISQCVADGDPRKDGGGVMSSIPGWNSSPVANIAASITNLWLTVCDLRAAANPTVAVTDTQTVDLTITAGPNYSISADIVDTGWVPLLGFGYYGTDTNPTAMTPFRPKCRRIGNVIHFKGQVVIPMATDAGGGTLVLFDTSTKYYGQPNTFVFQGVDATYQNGCTVDPVTGGLTFNLGTSVVPPSVWSGALDDVYSLGQIIALRPINLNNDYGTALSAVFTVNITSAGALVLGTVKDYEITVTRPAGYTGTSPLRFVTSNVRSGEYVPNYIGTTSDIHNAPAGSPAPANFPIVSDAHNVQWPFSCDAGESNQIGGFSFRLDGLMAYVAP
jgi:hypothetical protein